MAHIGSKNFLIPDSYQDKKSLLIFVLKSVETEGAMRDRSKE